jgi:hypothetical protein
MKTISDDVLLTKTWQAVFTVHCDICKRFTCYNRSVSEKQLSQSLHSVGTHISTLFYLLKKQTFELTSRRLITMRIFKR